MTAKTAVETVQARVRAAVAGQTPLRIVGSGYEAQLGNPVKARAELDTTELTWVRDFDPDELIIRVGAGTTAGELAARLGEQRLRAVIPSEPAGRTIGGIVATGSSGYARLRHGPLRNHVIGITIVSGAGDLVSAGGQVVKNVTGYDLSRLCVASMGRLGVLVEVALRVYAVRDAEQVIEVRDPEAAWRQAHRPLAVVGTRRGTSVLVDGSEAAVAAMAKRLGGTLRSDAALPSASGWPWRATIRSRPSQQPQAIQRLPAEWSYIAQFGTGLTEVGGEHFDAGTLGSLRQWVEAGGGRLVLHRVPPGVRHELDPWGTPPAGLEIQRRIIRSFDPHGILNPGILPGGL